MSFKETKSYFPALRHVGVLLELDREHGVEEVFHVPLGGVGHVEAPVDRRDVDDGQALHHLRVSEEEEGIDFLDKLVNWDGIKDVYTVGCEN